MCFILFVRFNRSHWVLWSVNICKMFQNQALCVLRMKPQYKHFWKMLISDETKSVETIVLLKAAAYEPLTLNSYKCVMFSTIINGRLQFFSSFRLRVQHEQLLRTSRILLKKRKTRTGSCFKLILPLVFLLLLAE